MANIESRKASCEPERQVQPRPRMRSVLSLTIGTSPFQPRFPPAYSNSTWRGSRPAHSAANCAISFTGATGNGTLRMTVLSLKGTFQRGPWRGSMFERYTEKARRVIFFARYEASQFGSPYIETEHLLLGLLREDKALTNRFLRSHASVESIRKQIEGHTTIREKVSTSVDLPLSNECKRVLAYAAEEAERLGHKHIGTEHLLLGLLREEKCFAAEILQERGLKLTQIRDELARVTQEKAPPQQRQRESSLLAEFSRDLTQAAMDGQLDPLVGRDGELERVVQILCRRTKNNPVLIGEPGVGKTAIVEGLAQRIV